MGIYYKLSLFNAQAFISFFHIYMNMNKLCLNQSLMGVYYKLSLFNAQAMTVFPYLNEREYTLLKPKPHGHSQTPWGGPFGG